MWIKLLGLFPVIGHGAASLKQNRENLKYQIDYTLQVRGLEKLKEKNFMKSIPAYPDQQAYTAKNKEF